ncbi:zinc-binding oxidoreductase alcohol dehydrogenase [Aulographum hederae CBS 113979]|uniref:Zinc-binding oxidoreductase alcohol dehydrogenase n=1 Tax=Aulographum hederae CBS 113979 TaxID=1176131 RepID=A0A6G1HFW6_9PEZI|nr:zinc-binding oxidoreductase alcohol dehydrogenase [Aulographum hederae CBS 113979]
MKVLKIQSAGVAAVVDAPTPTLRPDYVLIKNSAVALNPTDWKHIDKLAQPGATVGCDFAGTIEEVGSAVTKSFKKGDRVTGVVHGGNAVQPEDGAFGEYLVAKANLTVKIPDGVSFEDAATLGVGITTVGQGLYQALELPLPSSPAKEKFPILIYGGSTATGTLAIQFAILSGLEVYTTCSPRNFDLVKSLGAKEAFDYNSSSCGADIRAATGNALYYVFDTISEGSSIKISVEALSSDTSSKKAKYSNLLPVKIDRQDVEAGYTLAYTAIGEDFTMGPGGPAFQGNTKDLEFSGMFAELAIELLGAGKFAVHPPEIREGGLEAVLQGLDDLRHNRVSGKKLVYRVGN